MRKRRNPPCGGRRGYRLWPCASCLLPAAEGAKTTTVPALAANRCNGRDGWDRPLLCSVDELVLLLELLASLLVVRVRHTALDRAHRSTLLLVVFRDTFAAERGVDDVDVLAL